MSQRIHITSNLHNVKSHNPPKLQVKKKTSVVPIELLHQGKNVKRIFAYLHG